MKIYTLIKRGNKKKIIELKKGSKALDLLKKLNINSNTCILVRNKEVIIEQTTLKDKDKIEVLIASSKG